MRMTIELPDDRYRLVQAMARDTSRSLSETVSELIRRGLASNAVAQIRTSPRTGLPVLSLGNALAAERVRALEDDE